MRAQCSFPALFKMDQSSGARIKALAFSPLPDIMRIILIIIIVFVELPLQNCE